MVSLAWFSLSSLLLFLSYPTVPLSIARSCLEASTGTLFKSLRSSSLLKKLHVWYIFSGLEVRVGGLSGLLGSFPYMARKLSITWGNLRIWCFSWSLNMMKLRIIALWKNLVNILNMMAIGHQLLSGILVYPGIFCGRKVINLYDGLLG